MIGRPLQTCPPCPRPLPPPPQTLPTVQFPDDEPLPLTCKPPKQKDPGTKLETRPETARYDLQRSSSGTTLEQQQELVPDSGLDMKKEEAWSEDCLGPSTKCKICNNSFSSRSDFTEHLALIHFRPQLERSLGGLPTCPSCCLYRTKDPAQLVVHYGARCRPFPVKQLYAEWLERHKAGHSSDVCIFCGHKGHSPSDLSAHIG